MTTTKIEIDRDELERLLAKVDAADAATAETETPEVDPLLERARQTARAKTPTKATVKALFTVTTMVPPRVWPASSGAPPRSSSRP